MNRTETVKFRFYIGAWIALILMLGVELLLTALGLRSTDLLAPLLAIGFVQGGIVVVYVMRLKYERPRVFWGGVSSFIVVLLLMGYIWSDALRAHTIRLVFK